MWFTANARNPRVASMILIEHLLASSDSFVGNLFKVYVPRRYCMYNEQPVIWLHVISDLLIALAYFSIPFALVYLVRRRKDMKFGSIFWMFAAFILACGTTHLIGMIDVWKPFYRLDGVVKLITAVLSVITAVALWRLMPLALAMPGTAKLEATVNERTAALEKVNQELRQEAEERKRAEHAVAENEAKFRQLANSIPQLAWMSRPDGWISWYNDRWYEYTGTTPEQMLGTGWQKVQDPTELARMLPKWQQALASGQPWEDTFPLRRSDGEFRWHLSRALPVRDLAGHIVLWIGTNTDVTEHRQMVQQRDELLLSERAARATAEHASRMKDEFLATLSHEVRTPLNAILGWAQILRKGPPAPEDLRQGLEVIERNARAQTQLIEDLLDMSRIIAGKLRLDVQTTDPVDFIEAAIATLMPAASARGVRIEKVLDPLARPVSGDPSRLQQVIWNLLSNAIKFTPRNGKVQVLLERVNSHIEISVADTGEGIDSEFLPYVFDRFRQADGSTTRKHGGLGLGLAIVKQLVELHGGSVRVKSGGIGRGTTFVVNLPLKAVHTPMDNAERLHPTSRAPVNPRGEVPNLAGLKVLVVDDEPDSRGLVQRVLHECGAEIFTAGSASEAMKIIASQPLDVLISDIGMTEMDGYDLLRNVRSLPAESGGAIPAIALTAFARSEDRTRALLAGFLAHLAKPVEPSELIATVAAVAGRTGLRVSDSRV
jgi:PAS domain S-box-containing protein